MPVLFAQRGPHKPKRGGCMSCLMAFLAQDIRAGYMYNEGVNVRLREYLRWIPVLNWVMLIIDAVDIFSGKTWTEIEIKERLRDPDFVDWHKYMVEKYQ